METPASITQFWFGKATDDALAATEQAKLWWAKHPATDIAIRERFEGMTRLAADGALSDWAGNAQGRLALILLTDQFPRNMYRDDPRAFAFDGLANTWCKEGLAMGVDQQLRSIERVFFYLPLEHAESLADQELAVSLFDKLLADVPAQQRSVFAGFHDFAVRHHVIVKRFGRFPHRNAILGRVSSAEEIAFLQEKGSSF